MTIAVEQKGEPMSDLIDRQKAIDVVKRLMGDYELSRTVQMGLHILPSAQPEPCGDMISREYLKEHIEACWINGRPRHAPELNELLSWVDDVPSAEPEIIRCKDCKYFELSKDELASRYKIAGCFRLEKLSIEYPLLTDGNGFCSWAERRQNG